MAILVVGGAGYIGSHCVKLLRSKNHSLVIFDNLSTGHIDAIPTENLVVGDLADLNAINKCFENNEIDMVMHFASSIAVGESVINPAKYYRNNVINTINLLDAMHTHHVKKIIFSSTAAVYGEPLHTPISVDHIRNPVNPYGKSKMMVEQIIEDYGNAYGLHYIFLRYFNAAGADPSGAIGERHHPETHLIPLALQVAAGEKDELLVYGNNYKTKDGTCIRDYVHVYDIAQAHLLSINYLENNDHSACFNLGTNTGITVKEVIDAVESITEKKVNVRFTERRAGDSAILVADAIEAMKKLGWNPLYPNIKDIIQHAWTFYSKMIAELAI